MKKTIILFVGIIILAGAFFLGDNYYSNLLASLTYRDQIKEVGREGFGNSITFNLKDEPIVSYIEENKLIFKEKKDNVFLEEIVARDALSGNKTKIAIDTKGNVYILYITKENYLKLAKKEKNSWQFEEIFQDAAIDCNLYIGIDDSIYVSFWSPKDGLAYGEKRSNNWEINIIDYGKVGWWNSMAIDSNGYPHISYFDFENKNLLYIYFDGNFWKKEIVDKEDEVGSWNSLVLDQENRPSISYFDQKNGNLKFAQKSDGGWLLETPDKKGIVGERTNIVLDKEQNPIIAYAGLSENSFKVAKKTKQDWKTLTVSLNNKATSQKIKGEGSLDNSIAIDNEGVLHLLWQDFFEKKLNYLEGNF